jgi:2,3-bisphosphoglycerate-dependent phosphoglycerate mutase
MMELLLARHGLAHCNVAGIVGGPRGCTGLTDRGREQAALLGSRLRREVAEGQPIAGVHASPRRRARETLEFIADTVHVPVRYDDRLTDPDLGPNADGRSWSDIRAALSLGANEFPETKMDGEGETWAEYVRRVVDALSTVVTDGSAGRHLVIGHSETVLAAFHLFLGLPPGSRLPFDCAVDHAALTIWRLSDRDQCRPRWTLVRHNDVSHLVGRAVLSPMPG